jgi:DedD protein
MQRSFAEEEFEEERPRRDKEITLGPAMLLAILSGLVLLCGLCFGVGYTAGRSSAPRGAVTITQSATGQTLTSQSGSALQKPQAKGIIPPASPQQTVVPVPQSTSSDGTAGGNPLTSYAPTSSSSAAASNESQVRPALAGQPGSPANNPGVAAGQVQPAFVQGGGIMVQIAAVSHIEDANVLMSALRKRGYAVVARRGSADSLIHVQIGPFSNRTDANAMGQRLLSDGYNAVVMP